MREALQAWPAGTVRRLRILAERYPRSALVRLELGLALALSGQQADATRAWQAAERVQPDSPRPCARRTSAIPDTPPGLPPFVPSFTQRDDRGPAPSSCAAPPSSRRCGPSPPSASSPRPRRLAPNDPEALTAAAVGLYDKDRPRSLSRASGPLARRFPQAQTVRFHLGLLLIYFGDLRQARRELALARAQGPTNPAWKEGRNASQGRSKA